MPEERQRTPEKKIEQLIFRDELTGVFNRRYLFQYLAQEIQRVKNQKENLWLFMIDVDDFKIINDKYGHLSGDIVLKSIADILQRCVRTDDTVIRYAGDEFTVILPSGKIGDVLAVADRIIKVVCEYKFISESNQPLGRINLSIGIANYPDDAEDSVRLIDLADKALYASKQAGKNRVSLVSDIAVDILRGREILERFPCSRLIERDNQWQQLINAFQKPIKDKNVELVTITGPAGIGKTRLIDELRKYIISDGKVLFFERCLEKCIMQPYRNLLNSIERYLRSLGSADVNIFDNIPQRQLGILSKVLPVIKEVFGIQGQEDDFSREKIEEEFTQGLIALLKNISYEKGLFILFDDFHYIDEKTLQLFYRLTENISSIMFCFAFPKGQFLSQEELEYPLFKTGNSLIERSTTKLELMPLSFNGTCEMVNTILDIESPEKLLNLIYKITKGSPLFIEELLKFLIQKGFLYYQKGAWGNIEISESDIPNSLEGLIQERIKSLDKHAQEIISKAAVIGQDFNSDILSRMGKEDEGYILDILESAKRVGLIKETTTAYGEELSFVSEEIRKVLYNLMKQDETKNLHKKLGEIKEGLHADNLDKIAGELFYHFKKAEDSHRATQYAKRIRETEGIFYDRAIKYAKEILEGMGDKKTIAHLSKKSMELIPDIVRLIYIINLNIMLYPSRSETITTPLDELFKKLSEIFVRDQIVIFSEVKGALIINGERPKGVNLKKIFEDAFLSFLKTHGIESLSFKRGLTKAEFSKFIETVNKAPEDKNISELVKAKDLLHIEVNDIAYEMVDRLNKTEERERLEEAMLIDYLLGKITGSDSEKEIDFSRRLETHAQEISDAITKIGQMATKEGQEKKVTQADVVSKSIQKIGSQIIDKNPRDWDKYKKSLAKTIINLEPKLRKEILLSENIATSKEKQDIMKDLIPEFPDEVIVNLLTEEFEKEKSSPTKMRYLIQRLLSDEKQRQRILPSLKEKLIRDGLSKDKTGWIFGEREWKDLDLKEKIERFLEMSPADYLNLAQDIKIDSLIADIISEDNNEILIKVLNKWMDFFNVKAADIRLQIAKATQEIISAIPPFKHEALSTFMGILCNQLDKERQIEVYYSILDLITQYALNLINKKDFIPVRIIIQRLNRLSASDKSVEQQRILQVFKGKIIQLPRLKMVVEELIKRVDENSYYNDILEFIFEIGDLMVELLIKEAMIEDKVLSSIGYFGAFLRRRAIGEILSKLIQKLGRDRIIQGLNARLSSPQWYIVKNAIELFIYIHDQELVKFLEPVLRHPDVNIRTRLIFALARLKGEDSIRLLIKALNDKDKTICLHAVQTLAKIGDKTALDALKKYTRYPDIKTEVENAIKKIEERITNN